MTRGFVFLQVFLGDVSVRAEPDSRGRTRVVLEDGHVHVALTATAVATREDVQPLIAVLEQLHTELPARPEEVTP